MKLGIIATHPIQYHAPWFRALASRSELDVRVAFVRIPDAIQQGQGFGIQFKWDVPLLDGYSHCLIQTRSFLPRVEFFRHRIIGFSDWLKKEHIEVLLSTGWNEWPLLQAAIEARLNNVPVLVRGETTGFKRRPLAARVTHAALLRLYDAFLVIGEANRHFYSSHGVSANRQFVAPYFVDNMRFSQQAESLAQQRTSVRERWGIQADQVCFLFVGKLEPKKHVLSLLEALRLGLERGAKMCALIVGTGEQLDLARSVAAEHHLPAIFAGFLNQTELASAYVACDCLVLPSDYGETWGLVVNEAMACGRPAIVSDRVGCGPDLVVEGESGAIFKFGDADALASLMCRFSSDRALLTRMGHLAQERVMRDFTAECSAQAVVDAVNFLRDAHVK